MDCFEHPEERFSDCGVSTATSKEQENVEEKIAAGVRLRYISGDKNLSKVKLQRQNHIHYLSRGLKNLPENLSCLDASRPWMVFWILHSLDILDVKVLLQADAIVEFLSHCQNPDGGFGGGPGQISHLAPTYAAVNALAIVGTTEAYNAINREALLSFLWRMRTPDGAFQMHEGGEVDMRGVYCAVSVARLTNLYTEELFKNTPQWIVQCQTYEGGFSGSPGLEAHGGYTCCGLAALNLLNAHKLCRMESLLRWAVNRQMRYEGGFQGRTNKLVDGCYSYWQGSLFPMLHFAVDFKDKGLSTKKWFFHQEALQKYLLFFCQHPRGGLIDKPGKAPDFYHTCYGLSGLSIAQHFPTSKNATDCIIGDPSNEVASIHVLYNLCVDTAVRALEYFKKLPIPNLNSSTNEK